MQKNKFRVFKKNIEWGRKMLRHIISVSLAMTACATLIATKTNAVNFTLTPLDGVQRNPGDKIEFRLDVNPQGSILRFLGFYEPIPFNSGNGTYDSNELSFRQISPLIDFSQLVGERRFLAVFRFEVINPIRDGESDLAGVQLGYVNLTNPTEGGFRFVTIPTFDVQPVRQVPEPLTIFGAAAALGYGAILKRQSSKKTIS